MLPSASRIIVRACAFARMGTGKFARCRAQSRRPPPTNRAWPSHTDRWRGVRWRRVCIVIRARMTRLPVATGEIIIIIIILSAHAAVVWTGSTRHQYLLSSTVSLLLQVYRGRHRRRRLLDRYQCAFFVLSCAIIFNLAS